MIFILEKAFIQKQHPAPVSFRPDHPACGLQNFIHARIPVYHYSIYKHIRKK